MERKKASDFPQDLLDLFDQYVHGGISRRDFIDGAQKFAVGGVTATALFGWRLSTRSKSAIAWSYDSDRLSVMPR